MPKKKSRKKKVSRKKSRPRRKVAKKKYILRKKVYRKKSKLKGTIPKSVISQNVYHHMNQINRKPKKKS